MSIKTVSNKLRYLAPISKYIMDTIDSDREIKRLMRWVTLAPLSKRSEDYNGKVVSQYDLVDSLMSPTKEGNVKIEGNDIAESNKCLFSGLFDPNMINIKIPKIFVTAKGIDSGRDINNMIFSINILVSDEQNNLKSYGQERIFELAIRICDLFDGTTIDNEEVIKSTGDVEFNLSKKAIIKNILGKSQQIYLIPIQLEVFNIGGRVVKDD